MIIDVSVLSLTRVTKLVEGELLSSMLYLHNSATLGSAKNSRQVTEFPIQKPQVVKIRSIRLSHDWF